MLPQVRYARSSDGTSIAYWMLGSGPPLVLTPLLPFCHLQLEWEIREFRDSYEALASEHTLVAFDARGLGMSQRHAANLTLEAYVADIDAVTSHLGLRTVALLGMFHGGPMAIRFAARHPERVSRLILWATYADPPDYAHAPRVEASRALLEKDWEGWAETIALYASGWANPDLGRATARLIREAVTSDEVRDALAATDTFNVTADLASVRCPTLVMYRRKIPWPDASVAQQLASNIAGARLVGFDGDGVFPWACETEQVIATINGFLGEGIEVASPSAAPLPSALEDLTDRELEVLRHLASGSSNKEIATALTLSVHTIERHLVNIYGKIGARGRSDATAFALRNGLS